MLSYSNLVCTKLIWYFMLSWSDLYGWSDILSYAVLIWSVRNCPDILCWADLACTQLIWYPMLSWSDLYVTDLISGYPMLSWCNTVLYGSDLIYPMLSWYNTVLYGSDLIYPMLSWSCKYLAAWPDILYYSIHLYSVTIYCTAWPIYWAEVWVCLLTCSYAPHSW